MGTLQSIFFRPARGYRKYETSSTLVSSSFGNRSTETSKKPSSTLYQLDGVLTEQHTNSVRLTKHPVEFGVDISDHIIKEPRKIIVNGIVTNSPMLKQLLNRLPGDPNFGSQALSVLKGSRARNAYKGLVDLQNERKPVVLQTGLLVYDNMVLTNISAPNDIEDNLKVSLTFEEVFIIDGENTKAISAVTNSVTNIDFATVVTSLVGLGIAGLTFL